MMTTVPRTAVRDVVGVVSFTRSERRLDGRTRNLRKPAWRARVDAHVRQIRTARPRKALVELELAHRAEQRALERGGRALLARRQPTQMKHSAQHEIAEVELRADIAACIAVRHAHRN